MINSFFGTQRLTMILLGMAMFCVSALASDQEARIVATVGEVQITATALEDAISIYVPPGAFHLNITGAQRDKYRKEALEQLIDAELLYKEAKRRNALISDEQIADLIAQNIEQFGTEKKFKEALKRDRLTMSQLKERIRKIQSVNRLNESLMRAAEPSEESMLADYEKNKSRYKRPESLRVYHILQKVEPSAPEAEWQKKKEAAEAILRRIRSGEDFGALAYELSEDPFKVKSGDLGFIHRDQFDPKELEDVAFGLNEGGVSDIVRTIHGFHIIKAGQKRPEELLKFEDVKETIKNTMRRKNFDEKKSSMLDALRKEYPVKILISLDKEATDAASGSKRKL